MDDPHVDHALRLPAPRLRPFVNSYVGYRLSGFEPTVHPGLPSGSLTFIIAFDDPLDVTMNADGSRREEFWSMLAGLHSTPAFVRHSGRQHGIQLAVTPLGSRVLFGLRPADLAATMIHLDDVAPFLDREIHDRLSASPTWAARFAVLDDALSALALDSPPISDELRRAWSLLRSTHGTVAIDDLAADVGWGRRHLADRFRQEFGLTPKVMARVLRFERAQNLVRLPTRPSLAAVAAACGYSDQAHMTREWREFGATTPGEWRGDVTVPFLQDEWIEASSESTP